MLPYGADDSALRSLLEKNPDVFFSADDCFYLSCLDGFYK
jgi:hypothetical protein